MFEDGVFKWDQATDQEAARKAQIYLGEQLLQTQGDPEADRWEDRTETMIGEGNLYKVLDLKYGEEVSPQLKQVIQMLDNAGSKERVRDILMNTVSQNERMYLEMQLLVSLEAEGAEIPRSETAWLRYTARLYQDKLEEDIKKSNKAST